MRCLVIEKNPVSLAGYKSILESNFPSWDILSASTTAEGVRQLRSNAVYNDTMVIFDLFLHPKEGVGFLSSLNAGEKAKKVDVIVISDKYDSDAISLCRRLGVRALMTRDSDVGEIIRALHSVSTGSPYFRVSEEPRWQLSEAIPELTNRQRDLIELLLVGCSNKMIANTLGLSYGTVKNYMFDLMRLLRVNSRLELVAKIRESGYRKESDDAERSPIPFSHHV